MHDRFASDFAYWSAPVLDIQGTITSAEFVPITWLRAAALRWLLRFDKLLGKHPLLAPLLAVPVAAAAAATYFATVVATSSHSRSLGYTGYSGIFAVFRPSGPPRLPRFGTEDAGYWARKQARRQADRQKMSVPHDV